MKRFSVPRSTTARRPGHAGMALLAMALALPLACGDGPNAPEADRLNLAALAGDGQLGAAGLKLLQPLQVLVTDAVREEPVEGVRVRFILRQGSDGTLTPSEAVTNDLGIASASFVLGSALGDYMVEARADNMVGDPATFSAEAVPVPTLAAVTPTSAAAGDTITVTGTNFRSTAAENRVTVGGLDARVVSATATELRAEVPACVPNRTLQVRVRIGSAVSGAATLATTAATGALQLEPGQVRLFAMPGDLACVRLAADAGGAAYYVSVLNAADVRTLSPSFEILGLLQGSSTARPVAARTAAAATDPALAFETWLRQRERGFPADALIQQPEGMAAVVSVPQVGDQSEFNVINRQNQFEKVTAEVKAVSQRAVIYQDVQAPAGGFGTGDFQAFAALFDDPIYATVTNAFGQPSDIDANGRVTILLTPKVNALTEAGQSSFIAGYFYGCDLVEARACSGTNRAEIFYSMVPDPAGVHGNVRPTSLVLRTVPAVLAHEFQHMINFHAKGLKLDALWLSEALAHTAEDLVGKALLAAGQTSQAEDFLTPNRGRARRYLESPAAVSLLHDVAPGTLAFRGGAWLLLEYARSHFGGTSLLRTLTTSSRTSVDNFTAATGQPWAETLAAFSVALWADGAPELDGVALPAAYTFPELDLRAALGSGGYPLRPVERSFTDFAVSRVLPSASFDPFLLRSAFGAPAPAFHLIVASAGGAPFPAGADPAMALLRVR
ncbi:MAG: IPT/TIG domain-containing protein [Gemmatimonadota bacterium]